MEKFDIEKFLAVTYRLLLNRDVDPDGKEHYTSEFQSGKQTINRIIYSILQSDERANLLKNNLQYKQDPCPYDFEIIGDFMRANAVSQGYVNYFQLEYAISRNSSVDRSVLDIHSLDARTKKRVVNTNFTVSISDAERQQIEELSKKIIESQGTKKLYQPIYKIESSYADSIERSCIDRFNYILNGILNLTLANMSVLDVGCNLGFFSFSLSNYFTSVLGLEIDQHVYNLAKYTENLLGLGNVTIANEDFFKNIDQYVDRFDVCLMLSTIHYLVHANGLRKAISIFDHIVNSFDYVVIEMSTSKDYEFMPSDPNYILDKIHNCEVKKIAETERNNRGIYLIKKKTLQISGIEFDKASYRIVANQDKKSTGPRLYYSEGKVYKKFPFTAKGFERFFLNELSSYMILKDQNFVPKFYNSFSDLKSGYICIQYIEGTLLYDLMKTKKIDPKSKEIILCKIIVNLIGMLRCNLFWNDLSSHNIFVSDEVKFFDFANASRGQSHDHLAMLTWIISDLQKNFPESYNIGIYEKILEAKDDKQKSAQFYARHDDDYFDKEVLWIYKLVTSLSDITDLKSLSKSVDKKVKSIANKTLKI